MAMENASVTLFAPIVCMWLFCINAIGL